MNSAQVYQAEPDGERLVEFILPVDDPLTGQVQTGSYRVDVDSVSYLVNGPWELSWQTKP